MTKDHTLNLRPHSLMETYIFVRKCTCRQHVATLIYTINNHIEENRHQHFIVLDLHSLTDVCMGAL